MSFFWWAVGRNDSGLESQVRRRLRAYVRKRGFAAYALFQEAVAPAPFPLYQVLNAGQPESPAKPCRRHAALPGYGQADAALYREAWAYSPHRYAAARDSGGEHQFFSEEIVRRAEAIEENGFSQAEILVRKYFGLSGGELDRLEDDEFFDLAAAALFLREQEIGIVRAGVLEALAKAFGK
jgi:hypothetical protein